MKDKFTNQELNDLWSALTIWEREIDKKVNPTTHKDIVKLIKKVRKLIKITPN